MFFIIYLLFFFCFYIVYNSLKYIKFDKKYFITLSILTIFTFILIVIIGRIWQIFENKDLFIILIYIYIGLIFSLFSITSSSFFIFLQIKIFGHPIIKNFKSVQSILKRLYPESFEKQTKELQEFRECICFTDFLFISYYYNEGIKQIKNSFGKTIHFDKIIHLNDEQNLNEILDKMTFLIPYYIFYGGSKQINEMNTHLENINKYLGEAYSINGHQFITEIFRMDEKINTYFNDNSFQMNMKITEIDKYSYHRNKIFLFILALLNSIILSLLISVKP